MFKSASSQRTHAFSFDSLNWVADEPLSRDQTQSQRLHEPAHLINTIDPMTGHDIDDVTSHPSLVDGNWIIYFETGASRKAYQDMPLNHPKLRLPFQAMEEDDRGG